MHSSVPAPPSNKSSWPWINENLSPSVNTDNSWPLISIVTPSYNQGQFLEETIRSVLLQGYPNFEYIIIDGGSTDDSVDVIQKYSPWLRYWVSERDRGQSHAINKGLMQCTGEIVCWLNSDDYLMPNTLFRSAEAFINSPNAGIIHGKAININKSGAATGVISGGPLIFEESLFKSFNPIAQPATFITRNVIWRVGGLDENLHMSMDWDLWLRISLDYPIKFVDEIWAAFRVWSGSKGSNILDLSNHEHFLIIKSIFGRHKLKQIPFGLKLRTLSMAYGQDALYCYHNGDHITFRWHLLLSILLNPLLKNRKGRNLIPEMLLGKDTVRLLRGVKNHIHQITTKRI